MTNILDGLLARIEDPELRRAISGEVSALRSIKDFGLVFERHIPENVVLYSNPIRRGHQVQQRDGTDPAVRTVLSVRSGMATLQDSEGIESERPVEELAVIRRFGEPVYPGLDILGTIERGGDRPFHTVINAENYHGLELLTYAYEERVDAIYIDPPYNSGARDWKYNNDYVDPNDRFRHSKWLAFMERRLRLAKRLLNPQNSVLIVTIDEKEYLRLGMLLEQVFPVDRSRSPTDQPYVIQMITSVISSKGTSRAREFSRVSEHIFVVLIGEAGVGRVPSNMLDENVPEVAGEEVEWLPLRRREPSSTRKSRPNQFYPIFVNAEDGSLHSIGDSLDIDRDRTTIEPPPGTIAFWPVNTKGREMVWGLRPETLRDRYEKGYFRLTNWKPNAKNGPYVAFKYLQSGTIEGIECGRLDVRGHYDDGAVKAFVGEEAKGAIPKTVWNLTSHNAETYGTNIVSKLIPGRRFDYPKSLYAVEDILRIFVADKPEALVLDFFAGSGTTAHAVFRLNHQDDGKRRSVLITNNEVSAEEGERLRGEGYQPGDPEWEALGIFEHVARPRIEAAVSGRTEDGSPVAGTYAVTDMEIPDQFPMADGFDENVRFLKLRYLDRNEVDRGKAFTAIAPLLWMRAGSIGQMIDDETDTFAAPADARYAILFDVAHAQAFSDEVAQREDVHHLYVVTDSLAHFQQVVSDLPPTIEVSMLYEDYLRNFELNTGGSA